MLPGPSAKTPPSFLHLTLPPFPSWKHCTVRMRTLACSQVQAPFGVSVLILGVGDVDIVWGENERVKQSGWRRLCLVRLRCHGRSCRAACWEL